MMTPPHLTPVVKQNLANYASAWSAAEYTREVGLRPIEQQLIAEFMPPSPAGILDVGCGAGRTTISLSQAGYAAIAIDLSPELLTLARRRYPHLDFRQMDATALAFPVDTFDAALFSYNGIDDIYPVAAREQCLLEVFRVLKPGATFIFSSHNLVGAIFSGGYWYIRGYINATRFLTQQWRNPLLREWYVRYEGPGGEQFVYSAPPGRTIDQLRRSGFSVIAVRGASGQRQAGRVQRREQHVYFVARKPLS
jgi:ubiquinone/menaquinone biosynthesis C-methylase UbiE